MGASAATIRVRVVECDLRNHLCIPVLEHWKRYVFFRAVMYTPLLRRYVIKSRRKLALRLVGGVVVRRVCLRTFLLTVTLTMSLHYFIDSEI